MLPRLSHLLRLALVLAVATLSAAPLRILVVSDDPKATAGTVAYLTQGGAQVAQASVASDEALAKVDVVVLHQSKFVAYPAAAQKALGAFAKRGGGVVAVHGAVAAGDAEFGKKVFGGAWTGESQKFANNMLLTIRTDAHPLTISASTFDIQDDTVYDLALNEKIFVLGSAFTPKVTNERRKSTQSADRASIYDIQPQLWAYEADDHRAAVFLAGAHAATLDHVSFRTFIARAAAWTAKRPSTDELCAKADLDDVRYPTGGPRRGADAVAQFKMQPGFKVSVLATEPLINKPIALQWDERGRLWVAETPEYPNGRRPLNAEAWKEGGVLSPGNYDRPARDKISVLVSTKHDGVFDQKVIFHEGLELITGFCIYKDGVIVVAQKNIVWLRDTDGDGKADKEEILFGGFTPGDTHFVANHFIVAPDGWIYASNGGGANATNGKTGEPMARITSGTFRFKPDGSAIEQVASQGGNSFGNEVTGDMELFHGKATNGNPIQHVVLPETILAKVPGTTAKAFSSVNPGRPVFRKDLPDRAPLLQIDQVGHYTAACATPVYEDGAWPKEYAGTVFITEPILDIIHLEKLVLDGPAYKGDLVLPDSEWLRSMDHWFCPIDVSFGPDGAMYILDFYTPVVAHNDTRGPLHSKSGASVRPDREHYFGRIYRIQHESAPVYGHPDLSKADGAGLVAAFSHPSKVVRFNALRVLMDRDAPTQAAVIPALTELALGKGKPEARILALWALQRLGKLSGDQLAVAATSDQAAVRKNAFLVSEAGKISLPTAAYRAAFDDADARVRLASLRSLGATAMTAEVGALLGASQAKFTDGWTKAASSAATSANPATFLEALIAVDGPTDLEFARSLANSLAASSDGSARLRVLQAAASARNLAVARATLQVFAARNAAAPVDQAATIAALKKAIAHGDADLSLAAVTLAAAWTKGDDLKPEFTDAAQKLLPLIAEGKVAPEARAAAARALVAIRRVDAAILPSVAKLFQKGTPDLVALAAVEALASAGDADSGKALLTAFLKSEPTVRKVAYAALMTRPEWAGLVLDALESKSLSSMQLGPLQASQLSRHPDESVSKRATAVFAKLDAGSHSSKDEIIAKLRPEVEKPGDIAKGKELFAGVCQTCHMIGAVGNDFGPNLQGIGSHPASELLVHIVDPNRMVDDEHRTWNIKLKDGMQYSALIGSENAVAMKLKQPGGVTVEVKVTDIASRTRVETSLMPEGFEGLGAEGLRNIIAYLRSTAISNEGVTVGNFTLLDLTPAFTADGRQGLYASREARGDTLPFRKYGQQVLNGVPFQVADPAKVKDGKNLIQLKGGPRNSYALSFPQSVEIPVGLPATRLHLLGGVAGWGNSINLPAMTLEIRFLSGKKQVVSFVSGREFADYITEGHDVPGSKLARGALHDHQVRTLVVPVESPEIIDKLVLSSPGNIVAPTTAAITVEFGGAPNPPQVEAPAPVKAPAKGKPKGPAVKDDDLPADNPRTTAPTGQKFGARKPGQLRVLVAGAGSSHNFPKFFLGTDGQVTKAAGYDVAATPNLKETLELLPQADLFLFSGNHGQFGTPEFQKAIRDFVGAGKGVVLLHAATWYNWPLETKYNDEFVCGGARGHGHSDFPFTVTKPAHPVMAGVPATFTVNDESYNVELTRPEGAEILGTIPRQNPKPGQSTILPSVWVVQHPKARIVCIALGHDEHTHDHAAYQKLLLNALTWVSGK
jgi:putative membrane-bound dehydrogenase-like protein